MSSTLRDVYEISIYALVMCVYDQFEKYIFNGIANSSRCSPVYGSPFNSWATAQFSPPVTVNNFHSIFTGF